MWHFLPWWFLTLRASKPPSSFQAVGSPLLSCLQYLIQYVLSCPPYLDVILSICDPRTRSVVTRDPLGNMGIFYMKVAMQNGPYLKNGPTERYHSLRQSSMHRSNASKLRARGSEVLLMTVPPLTCHWSLSCPDQRLLLWLVPSLLSFRLQFYMHYIIFPMRATCVVHLILLYVILLITLVALRRISICYFLLRPATSFLFLTSKYSPQHPVLRHPQSTFFLYGGSPNFTPIRDSRTCS